ncbi:hypothetical protein GCK72_011538 [Caenorhabditis remanei]|uniref:GIY-YIG domain-containing protein n=1 Tax=Caenorhabditis remanei TaxID=31234 RepID=A0A6A5HA57_CAERE|nr:hypothetical protein GCK72_011538 [Caenorhabditis remanei]KAF1763272.1 hypothetical protein GCK72_011538 [Caenorhabditis remanei]
MSLALEEILSKGFIPPGITARALHSDKEVRQNFYGPGFRYNCFCYMLLDPRILGTNIETVTFEKFVKSVFYVVKGTKNRPLDHFKDARNERKKPANQQKLGVKFLKIADLWDRGYGIPKHEFDKAVSSTDLRKRKGYNAYCYLLFDPLLLGNDIEMVTFDRFVHAVFYVGKGSKNRSMAHFIQARNERMLPADEQELCIKLQKIADFWDAGYGIPKHEFAHGISNEEAFVREGSMIEAIKRKNLKNKKGGIHEIVGYEHERRIPIIRAPQVRNNMKLSENDLTIFHISRLRPFVQYVFYVGKGTKNRPLDHFRDARKELEKPPNEQKLTEKYRRIGDIWKAGFGIPKHEISHGVSDKDAFVREACMIEALQVVNLTNRKIFSPELNAVIRNGHFSRDSLERALRCENAVRNNFDTRGYMAFCYVLIDLRVSGVNIETLTFETFVKSVFYIGKGSNRNEMDKAPIDQKMNKKLQTIVDIWSSGLGVPKIQFSHGVSDADQRSVRRANSTDSRDYGIRPPKPNMEHGCWIENKTRSTNFIYINYRKINIHDVLGYFIFLNTLVGAKVEKITTRRLCQLEDEFKRRLHDIIHSQLIGSNGTNIQTVIGLEEICDGCEKCFNIAKKCIEYGPLRFSTLQTMTYSKNYKKLHVTDKLFEDIAEYCISKSKNKEECFKELDKTILSTISCDKLAIWISESRVLPDEGTDPKYDHRHMPREVIDIILRKWSVKSIKLNMIYFTSEGMCSVEWLRYDYFTRVRLNDPYWETKHSDLKFSHVEVSLSYSQHCVKGLGNLPAETKPPAGYDNFIPNIRRMFPTDRIMIDLSHWYAIANKDIEKKMSTILQVVTMEQHQNLSLDIKFFVQSGIVKKLNRYTYREELLGIASGYVLQENRLHCSKKSSPFIDAQGPEVFLDNKWVGRRFQVKDTFNQFNFNLDVYIKEKELEDMFIKALLQEYPNSFVGHFYN